MSKKFIVPATIALFGLASSAVFAAALTKTGEIKSTDAAKHQLVLTSGDTFELNGKIKVEKLKVGEKVAISYEMKDGKMVASKVHPAK